MRWHHKHCASLCGRMPAGGGDHGSLVKSYDKRGMQLPTACHAPRHVMCTPCHVMLCHVMPCHDKCSHALPVPCHAMPCPAMLCHSMPMPAGSLPAARWPASAKRLPCRAPCAAPALPLRGRWPARRMPPPATGTQETQRGNIRGRNVRDFARLATQPSRAALELAQPPIHV